jgi:hypothetical protein
MIAEAAYYLAQKRGFLGDHSLEDWLAAEEQMRQVISPISPGISRYENFAAMQAAGDGIEGEPLKPGARAEATELVSVDATIDGIAREALEEARRVEEAQRYRNNPGPVVPPQKTNTAP